MTKALRPDGVLVKPAFDRNRRHAAVAHRALPGRQSGGEWGNGQSLARNVADPAEYARMPRAGL
jgi:hypothetical protein